MSPMLNMMFILIVLKSYIVLLWGQDQYCYNASQCVGNDWVLNQRIFGYGYHSLYGTNTSVTINYTTAIVYCYGAFACTDISFIYNPNCSVRCEGSHSCANIDGLSYIDAEYVNCDGTNACQNSNIRANAAVVCSGSQSCTYANISCSNVYARGFHSLYQATVISNGNSVISLQGYQAGFGATIKCKTGDTCNIYCYYNGCEMLYLECEQNSNCNIILNNNDTTITIPPIQNITEYNPTLYDIKYHSNAQSLTNNQQCNNALNYVYDNYDQKHGIIAINEHEQNTGPVCCRGSWSCENAGSIAITDTVSDIVVCSGYESCRGITINTTNHVYCEAHYSCYQTNISKADNVYCLGYACYRCVFRETKNIYCLGAIGCRESKIESNGHDIHLYSLGYKSGYETNIYCNIGDKCEIKCGAFQSCLSTRLHCNNNCIVDCNTDTGCPTGNYTKLTLSPTDNPTQSPSAIPTSSHPSDPTTQPSSIPTFDPTHPTTMEPTTTSDPSSSPTSNPTNLVGTGSVTVTILSALGIGMLVLTVIIILMYLRFNKQKQKDRNIKTIESEIDYVPPPGAKAEMIGYLDENSRTKSNDNDIFAYSKEEKWKKVGVTAQIRKS